MPDIHECSWDWHREILVRGCGVPSGPACLLGKAQPWRDWDLGGQPVKAGDLEEIRRWARGYLHNEGGLWKPQGDRRHLAQLYRREDVPGMCAAAGV